MDVSRPRFPAVFWFRDKEMANVTKSSDSSAENRRLLEYLLLLFIGLKLTGHIDWSWWWVLSPMWITAIVALVAGAIYFGVWLAKDSK